MEFGGGPCRKKQLAATPTVANDDAHYWTASGVDDDFHRKVKALAKAYDKSRKKPKQKPPSKSFFRAPARDIYGALETLSHPPKAKKRKLTSTCETATVTVNQLHDYSFIDSNNLPQPSTSQSLYSPSHSFERQKEELAALLRSIVPIEEKSPKTFISHAERKQHHEQNWAQMRPLLIQSSLTRIGRFATGSAACFCGSAAVISCEECSEDFCAECDIRRHEISSFSWHSRRSYHNGFPQHLDPCTVLAELPSGKYEEKIIKERYVNLRAPSSCSNCSSSCLNKEAHIPCVFMTLKGRSNIFLPQYRCCDCGNVTTLMVADIVEGQLWPGSCQVYAGMYIFHPNVLETFYFLKMESPSLSKRSFLMMLTQFTKRSGCVSSISPGPFKAAYNEWLLCQYQLDCLAGHDWMKCPGCHLHCHAVHLDGNKKLYRFKGHNQTTTGNHFKDIFIADDQDVNKFVLQVQSITSKSESSTCGDSHWKAARATSKRQKCLEETGLEVGCCRHAVLLKALNMFRGEIFAYPLYLHKELSIASHVTFICQDVICKYWPWMEKLIAKSPENEELQKLQDTKPFLSVFHAKAHDWTCQVVWGGRWQTNSAAQAGEEMEQANSYLSRCSLTTKTMDKGGREEQLTTHALYWNKKKISSLSKSLSLRYKKSLNKVDELEKQLAESMSKEGIDATVDIKPWKAEIQAFALGLKGKKPSEEILSSLGNSTDLKSMQLQIEILCNSMRQLKYKIAKEADSSKNRSRLRVKLERERKQLLKTVALYNTKCEDHINVDEITRDDFLFPWHNLAADSTNAISFATKRKLVDIQEHLARYSEERSVLIEEMKSVTVFLEDKIHNLQERSKAATENPTQFLGEVAGNPYVGLGLGMLMLASEDYYRGLLLEAKGYFGGILADQFVDDYFEEEELDDEEEELDDREETEVSSDDSDDDDDDNGNAVLSP